MTDENGLTEGQIEELERLTKEEGDIAKIAKAWLEIEEERS